MHVLPFQGVTESLDYNRDDDAQGSDNCEPPNYESSRKRENVPKYE